MDYIYGKLNNKVKSVEYNGINSATTNIIVDNSDREHRTIKVDVIKTPGTLTINNTNGESVSFNGSIDENITIDSPTTEQYQELVTKVNDLENNKLDKVTSTSSNNRVYGVTASGKQTTYNISVSPNNDALARFGTNGVLQSNSPINNTDVTNKEYVDNLASTKVDKGQPGSKWQLYGIGSKTTPLPNGNTISTAEQAVPNTVINRNTDGRAEIKDPINNLDIANKGYVDTKVSKSGDTITGNLTIQGNLSVSGTTTTVDTETLKVKDNVIVTNSDKNQLIDLSGLAINTDATNTFGIMYNPTSNTVNLGLGTITTKGKFTYNENEGLPLAIRDINSSFTQDHLISWSTDKNKLTDSGIDKSNVTQTNKENVFTKYQTMPGLRLTGTDTEDRKIEFVHSNSNISSFRVNGSWTDNNFSFSGYGRADLKFPGGTVSNILLDNNIKTINNTSLYDTEKGNMSIPVVTASTTVGSKGLSYLKIDDTIYNIVDSNSANYAKLDSSNSFNNLQTFSEVKVNTYLDINYPDIDIIRISENANGQLQFDFSRVGGGTTVLPSGSANNTATIITTDNIAANVANKLDKVTSQGGYRVYAISGAGSQGTVDYSPSSTGSTIMSRDAQGKAQVTTPTDSDSAKSITNVEYVKNYVKNNSSKLTVTDNEDGTLTLSF